MMMPGRNYSATTDYRYGFNGKENDNEVKGEGNEQDYGMRVYDTRVGKFLSVDPLAKGYPHLTPYQFASNCPITGSDLDGMEFEDKKTILAGVAALQNANKTSTQQNTKVQQSTSFGSLLGSAWQGSKDAYHDLVNSGKEVLSKKTLDNAWGTAKDIGNMALGDKKATASFTNRVNNFANGVSNAVAEPVMFVATMNKRSENENAYGFGYYGTQALFVLGTDALSRVVAESISMSGGLAAAQEGNQLIRNVLKDGVSVRFAEGLDDIRYMNSMNSKALYGVDEANPNGVITLQKGFGRADILEEAIHHEQRTLHGDAYFQENVVTLEIEAQDRLLRIGEKEHWSESEMRKIRAAKTNWENKLKSNK